LPPFCVPLQVSASKLSDAENASQISGPRSRQGSVFRSRILGKLSFFEKQFFLNVLILSSRNSDIGENLSQQDLDRAMTEALDEDDAESTDEMDADPDFLKKIDKGTMKLKRTNIRKSKYAGVYLCSSFAASI
jgi:hypothetical protein